MDIFFFFSKIWKWIIIVLLGDSVQTHTYRHDTQLLLLHTNKTTTNSCFELGKTRSLNDKRKTGISKKKKKVSPHMNVWHHMFIFFFINCICRFWMAWQGNAEILVDTHLIHNAYNVIHTKIRLYTTVNVKNRRE